MDSRMVAAMTACSVVLLMTSGCAAEQRILKREEVPDPVTLDRQATGANGIEVLLKSRISANGPGSWSKGALWDEYVLVIRNNAATRVTVTAIELEGEGVPLSVHTTRGDLLEAGTRANVAALNAVGLVGAGTALAGSVAVMASLGPTLGGGVAVAAAPALIVAIPVGLVVGAVAIGRARSERKQQEAVDYHLARRGLSLPITLEAGEVIGGSAFFAVNPLPRTLRVRSAEASGESETLLDVGR